MPKISARWIIIDSTKDLLRFNDLELEFFVSKWELINLEYIP